MAYNFNVLSLSTVAQDSETVSYEGEIVITRMSADSPVIACMKQPVHLDTYCYILVLRGTAEISVDDVDYNLGSNSFCQLTPLHLVRLLQVSEDFIAMFVSASKAFVDRIPAYTVQTRILSGIRMHGNPVFTIAPKDKQRLLISIKVLGKDISDREHHFQLEMVRNSVVRFYLELDNFLEAHESELPMPRYAKILQAFMGLLTGNFRSEHSVPFYADALNLSPQYLTEVIKAQTGRTVSQLINEMLYNEARNLLSDSGMSIQQIAETLTFSDQSSFTKFFKRQSGSTPKEYRRKSGD